MTGHGDEIAARAAGRGHLRASHADRNDAVGVLKIAFVQGRLAKDEFDLRLGQALTARTCAELAALTADLPVGLTMPESRPSAPARKPAGRSPVRAHAGLTAVWLAFWIALTLAQLVGVFTTVATVSPGVVAALLVFHEWIELRDARQSPPGLPPGPGGRGTRRTGPARTRPRPPARPDLWSTAAAA